MNQQQCSLVFRRMNAFVGKWEMHPPKTENEWRRVLDEAEELYRELGRNPLTMRLIQTVLRYWEGEE